MNRDETIQLFLKGREVWNTWAEALLAERKAMEEAGSWKSRRDHSWAPEKGENPETQAWLDKASTNFSRCLFLLRGETGTKETTREDAKEGENGEPPIKLIHLERDRIYFSGFVFPSNADFGSATFSRDTVFRSATFSGRAFFEGTTFSRDADFRNTAFAGNTIFGSATFGGNADFGNATFSGYAYFQSAAFSGNADFGSAAFSGYAYFRSAAFSGHTNFASAAFSGNADFQGAEFGGCAYFQGAAFSGDTNFAIATFRRNADFGSATFSGNADFQSAAFSAKVGFGLTSFLRYLSFNGSKFHGDVDFSNSNIQRGASFKESVFSSKVSIEAHSVDGTVDLAGAKFVSPPLISQTAAQHLSVDNVNINTPSLFRLLFQKIDPLLATRFRRYKAAARSEHDNFSEHEFFVAELIGHILSHYGRFSIVTVSGLVYEFLSDFGRSILRPFLVWWATIGAFTLYFLAGQPEVAARWQAIGSQEASPSVVAYVKLAERFWRNPPACFKGDPLPEDGKLEPGKLYGLDTPVAETTNALAEAFRLAIRNGSIFLNGGDDSARRTYGCLYGIQSFGGSPVPFVPGFVTDQQF